MFLILLGQASEEILALQEKVASKLQESQLSAYY